MVGDGAAPETFATYLGQVLAGRDGFAAPLPPAFAPLAAAAHRVLALMDGDVLQIACLVDRDAAPDASFALSPADVLASALAWREAERQAGRRRASVVVTIYEIGAGIETDEAERRLSAYRVERRRARHVMLRAVLADTRSRAVWSNGRHLFGRATAFRWLRRLLVEPRLPKSDRAPAAVAHDIGRFPRLTVAIVAALAAIFLVEALFPIAPATGLLKADIRTLFGFGGVDRDLVVGRGQWWRIATAPLLHADALHILFNGWALWLIGRLSERLMGPAWFAAVFAVSALSGSALSILVNPANLLSVGASGAIVGLFVASFALSFHLPAGLVRSRLQARAASTLVPALLPFLSAPGGGAIDYGAHFGGAIGGLVMGLIMLAVWPRTSPRPRFAPAAAAVAVGGVALAGAAVLPDVANYRVVSLAQDLFEPFPKSDAEARDSAAKMIAAKPHDPRARFAHALALVAARDLAGADAELRTGLAEKDLLGLIDPPHYEDRMRIVLAAVLEDEERPDEARVAAAPACDAERAGPLHDALSRLHVCP